MINVLVVDDSAVARESLVHLINSAPGMQVIGTANDGIEAVAAAQRLRPDIITMDIIMPRMDGPEAIAQIMQTAPTPIVVVTGNTITNEVRATFQSLESGALAIVPRPFGVGSDDHAANAEHLIRTLRLMSEIKVVRRINRRPPRAGEPSAAGANPSPRAFRVVGMGASTGGPSVLKSILMELRKSFPAPILIVQHIAPGFVDGFVNWLGDSSPLTVRLAADGMVLEPATVYVAPDNANLGLEHDDRIKLLPRPSTPLTVCPSATYLFESLAQLYGPYAIGVLLTGMGRDGADGLLRMKQRGAVTIAQDKESSVVHGMPGEAITVGAADFVLPPARIADLLNTLVTPAFPLKG